MKVFGKFINWYFGRSALPYWCIMIFDLMVCFLSGVLLYGYGIRHLICWQRGLN